MVTRVPAAAETGKLLEKKLLGPTPELLNWELWGRHGFCVFTHFPDVLMPAKGLEPFLKSKMKQKTRPD